MVFRRGLKKTRISMNKRVIYIKNGPGPEQSRTNPETQIPLIGPCTGPYIGPKIGPYKALYIGLHGTIIGSSGPLG